MTSEGLSAFLVLVSYLEFLILTPFLWIKMNLNGEMVILYYINPS